MKVSSTNSIWYKRFFSAFILSLFGFFIVNISLAAWTPPASDPPNGNALEPIDISNRAQSKQGFLGINVTTPEHAIDVTGDINSTAGFCINGSCVTDLDRLWSPAVTSPDIFNSGAGKVGINVSAPVTQLDVAMSIATNPENGIFRLSGIKGDGTSEQLFLVQGNGKTSVKQLHINGGYATETEGWRQYQDQTSGNYDLAYIYDKGDGTLDQKNVLTVTPADASLTGMIGVNNTDPVTRLQVTDSTSEGGVISLSPGTVNSVPEFKVVGTLKFLSRDDIASDFWSGIAGYRDGYSDNTELRFYTEETGDGVGAPSQRMVIKSGGQVGINNASPAAMLDVGGDITSALGISSGGSITADGSITAGGGIIGDSLAVTNDISTTDGNITAELGNAYANQFCFVGGDCINSWTSSSYWTLSNAYGINTVSNYGVGVGSVALDPVAEAFVNVGKTDTSFSTRLRITDTDTPGAVPNNPELQLKYGATSGNHWGIYVNKSSSNSLVFWNGSNQAALTTAGSLGVGTISPSAKLEVITSTGVEGVRIVASDYSPFIIRNTADNADLFRVDQSGNVGIGTSPNAALNVSANSPVFRLANKSAVNASGAVMSQIDLTDNYVSSGAEARIAAIRGAAGSGGFYPTDLAFSTTNNGTVLSEQMRINYVGNVGIGTSSPAYHLDVRGGSAGGNILYMEGNNQNNGSGTTLAFTGSSYQGNLVVKSGSAADANAGINLINDYTTDRRYSLLIDAADYKKFKINTDTSNSITGFAGTNLLTIDTSGKMGIGTTSPIAKLTVNGDVIVNRTTKIGSTQGATGKLQVTGNIDIAGPSNSASQINFWTYGDANSTPDAFIGINNYQMTIGNSSALGSYYDFFKMQAGTFITTANEGRFWNYTGTVNQSGTASYTGLKMNITETALGSGASYLMRLQTGGSDRFMVSNVGGGYFAGNVGVGTNTPNQKLEVNGNLRLPTANYLEFADGSKYYNNKLYTVDHDYDWTYWNGSSVQTYVHLESSNGYVGIGNSNPGYPLDVTGDINLTGTLRVNGSPFSGSQWTTSGSTIYYNSGYVGIGATTPTLAKLQVTNTTTDNLAWFSGNNSAMVIVNNTNEAEFVGRSSNNSVYKAIGFRAGASTGQLYLHTNGNVGIGEINPDHKLTVSDSNSGPIISLNGDSTNYRGLRVADLAANEEWFVGSNDMSQFVIRRNSTTDDLTIDSSGNITIAGALTVNGKINAAQLDPPYKINNKSYATYGLSMVGSKEEYSAVVTLQKKSKEYLAVIDFSNQPEDSDLWLFSKVTNLSKVFDMLIVQLTANFSGQVWYEKDASNQKVIIHATPDNKTKQNLEVSLRLTAPRFDYKKWLNTTEPNSAANDLDEFYKNEK